MRTPEQRARHAEYERLRYHQRRAAEVDALGGKCAQCGSTEQLEFDHVEPEDKSFNVAERWSIGLGSWHAETSKCQLLCRDCHQEKTLAWHAQRAAHNRWRYQKHGCRCDECRADYSAYRRARYAEGRG